MVLATRSLQKLKAEKAQSMQESREKAALVIQKTWRGAVQRYNYLRIRDYVIGLQARVRMIQAKKRYIILLHHWKREKAATLIKAAWRGYKARKALESAQNAAQLQEVQRKVTEAQKNATEEAKLCNRTSFALDNLFKYKDMGMLIEALNNLNVTLRYSTSCCLRMATEEQGKAVRILMELLNGLNRSVPHIEVMSIIFDILISLAEFHETRPLLAGFEVVYKSVIQAMSKVNDKDVFGKGCSLFWRLALEAKGRDLIRKDSYIWKKLLEFEDACKRKKKPPSASDLFLLMKKKQPVEKSKSLTTKHGCQLTENIVRHHTDGLLAINVLMKRLRK
jgi:hypothetical protein